MRCLMPLLSEHVKSHAVDQALNLVDTSDRCQSQQPATRGVKEGDPQVV